MGLQLLVCVEEEIFVRSYYFIRKQTLLVCLKTVVYFVLVRPKFTIFVASAEQ